MPSFFLFSGNIGFFIKAITGTKILRFDVENEEIIRGKDGFCIECPPGEAGEYVGPILDSNPLTKFHGYTDKKATEKKILRDVFKKGDMFNSFFFLVNLLSFLPGSILFPLPSFVILSRYMRTGDLLMRDHRGYYYFVDRIGDTFRWKGENVSTTEVAQIGALPFLLPCNVANSLILENFLPFPSSFALPWS